jgi:hypothetical protein
MEKPRPIRPDVWVTIKQVTPAGADKAKFTPFKRKFKLYETNPADVNKIVETALFAACFPPEKVATTKK